MATDSKITPKAVLEMSDKIYPKLVAAEDKNVALFNAYKATATGNKGKSYWNGTRAFNWYCYAVRSCANSHYRIARMATVYRDLCKSAIKVQQTDNAKSDMVLSLHTKVIRFDDLRKRCEGNYSKVITWGKS